MQNCKHYSTKIHVKRNKNLLWSWELTEQKNKRPLFATKQNKILFHDDNAKPHREIIVKEKVLDFGWDRLDQPAYSPDIAPSDYHLFRSMQMDLSEIHFRNVEEVRKWVDDWIAHKDEDFFNRGIHKLPGRWREVIANDGEYIG